MYQNRKHFKGNKSSFSKGLENWHFHTYILLVVI